MKSLKKQNLRETLILSLLVFSLISFWSCEQKDDVDYDLGIPDEYAELGKLHNQGLNYVFKDLVEDAKESYNGAVSTKSARLTKDVVEESVINFASTKYKSLDTTMLRTRILDDEIELKSASLTKDDIYIDKKWMEMISADIEVFMKDGELDLFKENLNEINALAKQELSQKELEAVYSATSMALATSQYWLKNYKKWYFASHYPEILEDYEEEQLNNIELKNNQIMLKSSSFSDLWNSVEDWWEDSTDAMDEWWDENGDDITAVAESDVRGAVVGWCTSLGNPQFAGCYATFSSGSAAVDIWW